MTAEKKAADLKKKFGAIASDVVDEIITVEKQFVSYINETYSADFIYDSIYWQQVKENLFNEETFPH